MELQTMPLKFRVWDKEEKKFLTDQHGNIHFVNLYWLGNFMCHEVEEEEYEISQDTGFKDKKGKNIYTGDIIKYNSPVYKDMTVYAAIAYRNGTIVYDYGDKFDFESQRYERVKLTMYDEVVGNIWQNLELLEEK